MLRRGSCRALPRIESARWHGGSRSAIGGSGHRLFPSIPVDRSARRVVSMGIAAARRRVPFGLMTDECGSRVRRDHKNHQALTGPPQLSTSDFRPVADTASASDPDQAQPLGDRPWTILKRRVRDLSCAAAALSVFSRQQRQTRSPHQSSLRSAQASLRNWPRHTCPGEVPYPRPGRASMR